MNAEPTAALRYSTPVALVGPVRVNAEMVRLARARELPIIAADGGANRLDALDIVPEAIIGDLDSLADRQGWRERTRIIEIGEQDTVDFEKCLYSIDAPRFLATGFVGGRIDHSLAVIHVMGKYAAAKPVLLIGEQDISFAHVGVLELTLQPDVPFSIFPLQPISFAGSRGLAHPLKGLHMAPATFIGTSNRTSEPAVRIEPGAAFTDIPYVITLPYAMLDHVIDG